MACPQKQTDEKSATPVFINMHMHKDKHNQWHRIWMIRFQKAWQKAQTWPGWHVISTLPFIFVRVFVCGHLWSRLRPRHWLEFVWTGSKENGAQTGVGWRHLQNTSQCCDVTSRFRILCVVTASRPSFEHRSHRQVQRGRYWLRGTNNVPLWHRNPTAKPSHLTDRFLALLNSRHWTQTYSTQNTRWVWGSPSRGKIYSEGGLCTYIHLLKDKRNPKREFCTRDTFLNTERGGFCPPPLFHSKRIR